MSEALDWSLYSNPEPLPSEEIAPERQLRLVEPLVEQTSEENSSGDAYIDLLVAAGETVISYKSAHRWPDGRPRRFGPTYPL